MNAIYHGDCLDVLQRYVPESAANLIVTSPPYGNQRKHSYGGVEPAKYVPWFMERAEEFKRVLTPDGSMVINICPHHESGELAGYVDELVAALRGTWYFKGIYYWRKTNSVPGNATHRLRNAVEPCYHFSLRLKPAFYPKQVRRPAARSSIERASQLRGKDFEKRESATGSGFACDMSRVTRRYRMTGSGMNFADTPDSICGADGLVLPDNVIEAACETRNLHRLYGDPRDEGMASAAFPEKLPAFFIDLFTKKGNVVLDPFAGSGTSAKVAQDKGRLLSPSRKKRPTSA
jgi:site-specific DNA-methyltransferase (adenine-specific)/site-specific DNA-methyltransferase (cytosine-N4-specific)